MFYRLNGMPYMSLEQFLDIELDGIKLTIIKECVW